MAKDFVHREWKEKKFCLSARMNEIRWLSFAVFSVFFCCCAVAVAGAVNPNGCVAREYGQDSIVCVCNATYCDTLPPPQRAPLGQFLLFSSSKDGLRFEKSTGSFSKEPQKASHAEEATLFTVDRSSVYQSVIGFGGGMSDSAGMNIASLSEDAQELLLRSYFSDDGLGYNVLRVPIGGTDFSTRPYSYDDDGAPDDPQLSHFRLAEEDTRYKIPYLKRAIDMSPREILLLGSAWSAPKWMKTNNDFIGRGKLKPEYYQLWADYYVKFLDEYGARGIKLWGITTQNEPADSLLTNFTFNCMGWTADEQRIWVGENLGPTLHARGYDDLQVLVMDDQRTMLPSWPNEIFADSNASMYASGIAVHWYLDSTTGPECLNDTHYLHPSKFLMYTEACNGDKPNEHTVLLGLWERGEKYAYSIIETMSNWVTGWVDWNLALDLTGGPTWAKNFLDAAVIVNASADEFYKQPTFYALGHFTKFVPNGSKHIGLNRETADKEDGQQSNSLSSKIDAIAFNTADNATVVVLLNKYEEDKTAVINDPERGELTIGVPARSMHTLIYW